MRALRARALIPALIIKTCCLAPSSTFQLPLYAGPHNLRRARLCMDVRGGSAEASPSGVPAVDNKRGGEEALQTRPVRLLALHGFSQDADGFRSKTGALRKGLKDKLEMVYIDAPCTDTHSTIGEGRSWYEFSKVDEKGNMVWEKFDETLLYLDQVFKEQGPFDGVVGFSQGACVAAMLAALQAEGRAPPHVRFGACVLFSGFPPRDPACLALFRNNVGGVRSLHVIGDKDTLVPPQRSLDLAGLFEHAAVVHHNKGHLVPSDRSVRDAFRAFIFPSDPSSVPSEPAPSEPAPSEPAPSEPAPSEPAPSEPAPTDAN